MGKVKEQVEQVACSVHGKMRSVQSMKGAGRGGYRCAPGFECKTGAGAGAAPAFAAQGMAVPAFVTGGGGQVECAAHGKMRSAQSVAPNGRGGFRCSPGNECKGAATGT